MNSVSRRQAGLEGGEQRRTEGHGNSRELALGDSGVKTSTVAILVLGSLACAFGAYQIVTALEKYGFYPCGDGLHVLSLQVGQRPEFTSSWNSTGFWAGPPIVIGGAVWTVEIIRGIDILAFNPVNGTELCSVPIGPPEHFATPAAGAASFLWRRTKRSTA